MPKTVESKLEHGKDGMPLIQLWDFENMLVGARTQKGFDKVMQIYEAGGWKWVDGDTPTDYTNPIKGQTYVNVADCFSVTYDSENLRKKMKITVKELYSFQNLTPSEVKDKNKPYRKSLVEK